MPEYEAFYHFSSDAEQFGQQVQRGLGSAADAIRAFNAQVVGTSAPGNLDQQLFRSMGNAQTQMRRAMAEALDPTKLGRIPTGQEQMRAARDAVAGAFAQARLEMDRMFRQLGPQAQEKLVQTGMYHQLVGAMGENLIKDAQRAYRDVWRSFDATIQQQLPKSLPRGTTAFIRKGDASLGLEGMGYSKLDPKTGNYLTKGIVGEGANLMAGAAQGRLAALYDQVLIDPDDKKAGTTLERNDARWVEAEQKALVERVKASTASAEYAINQDREKLAQALASLLNVTASPSMKKYADALKISTHPLTGMPVTTAGQGAKVIDNPLTAARLLQRIAELEQADRSTQQMLASGQVRRVMGAGGKSTPFAVDESGSDPKFFKWKTVGGIEFLEFLDAANGKTQSNVKAMEAWRSEFAALQRAAGAGSASSTNNAIQNQQQLGVLAGFKQGLFGRGFGSNGNLNGAQIATNLATTAGSAVRYSVAYGGFYMLTQYMKDALAIFMDYQDSFTDYEVAVGKAGDVTQSFTNQAMELSRVMGENVGAAMDAAARGVRAFAAEASAADKDIAGLATAEAAQKVGVIANKKLADATGDVIAIGTAYNLSAVQAQYLIPDALSNAKRQIGGDPAQIAQGLSNFAISAHEMGFTIQEAANLIALVQSRTDESGMAIATRLTRIGQILSGSTGKSLARDVNNALGKGTVDIEATPADQLMQFARAYVRATNRGNTGLADQIRSQLGGTANMRELVPILSAEGQDTLARALKNALPGAGTDEYLRKINNLVGTMNKLKASVQNIVVLMANSDIFAPFALAVKTLDPLLHLLEGILKVYEKIEGLANVVPFGGPVVTIGAEALLARGLYKKFAGTALAANVAGSTGLTGALFRSAGIQAAGIAPAATVGATPNKLWVPPSAQAALAANTAAQTANTAAQARQAAAANAGAASQSRLAVAANTASGALTRMSATAMAPPGWLGGKLGTKTKLGTAGVAGGILAFLLALDESARYVQKFQEWSDKRLALLGKLGDNAEEYRNSADALRSLGASAKKETSWTDRLLQFGTQGLTPTGVRGGVSFGATVDSLDALSRADARAANYIADQTLAEEAMIKALREGGKATREFGQQGARTADTLAAAMQSLQEQGYTAKGKLHLLFKALMTPAPEQLGSWETPKITARQVVTQMEQGLKEGLRAQVKDGTIDEMGVAGSWLHKKLGWAYPGNLSLTKATAGDVANTLHVDMQGFWNEVRDKIKAAGPGLTQTGLRQITRDAFDHNAKGLPQAEGKYNLDAERLREHIVDVVSKNVKLLQHQASVLKPLTPAELQALMAAQDDALNSADPSDPRAKARQARENFLELQALYRSTGSPSEAKDERMRLFREKIIATGNPLQLPRLWSGEMVKLGNRAYRRRYRMLQQMAEDLGIREHQMREAFMADDEDLRKAAEARAKANGASNKRLKQIRFNFAKQSFKDAGKDEALIEQLMESLDRETVKKLLHYRKTQIRLAKEALDREMALSNYAANLFRPDGDPEGPEHGAPPTPRVRHLNRVYHRQQARGQAANRAYWHSDIQNDSVDDGGGGSGDNLTAAQKAALRQQALIDPDRTVEMAKANLAVARANLNAIKDKQSSEYFSALQQVTQAEDALAKAISSHAGAIYGAQAAKANSQLVSARMAINTAAAQMKASAKGTDSWYQALASFYTAQWQMYNAVVQYKNNLDLLHGDMTDPVEQARDALRAARRQLASDRRHGAGKDTLAADKVAVEQAQNQLEQSKFQQRLQDAQTAERLGRMSFQAYMAYLENEHDRLTKIKHRTRQQQDNLDAIDQAIKDANNSMDGQFNLGNINTKGLVYHARQYAAEKKAQIDADAKAALAAATAPMTARTTNQTVSIQIDGADIAKVRRIIDEYVGKPGRVRTIQPRRR